MALAWGVSMAYKEYSGAEVRVVIKEGSDRQAVLRTLRSQLGDDYGAVVARLWTWRSGDVSKAVGSYVIKPGDRAWSVVNRLRTGTQTPVKLTFNNLRTVEDLAAVVDARLSMSADDFLNACDSVLPASGYGKYEYAAAFVPDTYEFYYNAEPEHVVKTLVKNTKAFWNKERCDRAGALGLSPVQVATLASIVEEETADVSERPVVARLYMNRLEKGMKLQADPTVKFAIGDFTIRRVTAAMLDVKSPYNTYKVDGLPPGPIRIVEKATVDAVLDAPHHSYIYMCAKEDFSGTHNFATDYATHRANARRYQQALDKRGIK